MQKYQIMISGSVMPETYTLEQLIESGVLDEYDPEIQVRGVGYQEWYVAREYPYGSTEKTNDTNDYVLNEDGTVTRKSKSMGYKIDEYGQIVRDKSQKSRRHTLNLSKDNFYFTANEQHNFTTVKTDGEWSIATLPASWVKVSICCNSVIVGVAQNNTSNSRQTSFVVKCGSQSQIVSVYQTGKQIGGSSSTIGLESPGNRTSSESDGCGIIILKILGWFMLVGTLANIIEAIFR